MRSSDVAIAGVARSRKDIAVVAATAKGRWWAGLVGASAPKVFAKLPFIDIPDRPADLAAYVVGPPLKQTFIPDIRLLSIENTTRLKKAVAPLGGALVARAADQALVELPVAAEIGELAEAAGVSAKRVREVGGFFQPIRFMAERVA